MKSFLDEVIAHLIATKGVEGLGHTTVVVPTRRAMLSVKECFRNYMRSKGLQGPIQLPELTSLSQLFDDFSPRYKADEIQLVCTLYRVYCEVLREKAGRTTDLPLDVFYGWGKQLVQDFSNIDKAYPLVMPKDFLSNTASARLLSGLKIDDELRERLLGLVSLRPYDAQRAESKRREFEVIWENLPLIYTRFQEALGDYTYEGARMRAALESWETEAVQRRVRNKHFVFAGFNYLVPAEKQLMRLLRDNKQATFYWDYPTQFQANTKAFQWIIRNAEEFGNALEVRDWTPKYVEVVCTASAHAQAQFVYDWLQKTHQKGERTAVVICDESALEQVIYALPNDAPETEERFKHINITKGFPLRHTAIYSKFLKVLQTPVQPFECEAVLSRLSDLLTSEAEKFGEITSMDEAVQLSWHELLARESVFQLTLSLNRFRQLYKDGKLPLIPNLRTLRLLLRRYLEGISFPFHGEPLADVQVTGVLETRAMDFDNVLLLNVEEGIVPNVSADISYLPYYLRKTYGLQTHEESTDVYAYNFFRLMYRAQHVTLLFTGSESKNAKKTMSRFLRQMMASDDFVVTKRVLLESNILEEPIVPVSHLPLLEKSKPIQTFSPSALNEFRTCQMRFYLRYVVDVKELQQAGLLLERNEIGTIVHNSMQELYRLYKTATAIPEPIPFDDLQALKLDGSHPLELSAIRNYISRIVQIDRELAHERQLEITATEAPAYMFVEVPEFGQVRVGGRIDRVDKVDGVTRIIDYKTGGDKDDYDFQIRVYREAYLASGKVSDVQAALYLCKTGTVREVAQDPNFMAELTTLLHDVLTLMNSEQIPAFAEKAETCTYCPYKLLCGRGES